MYRRILYLSYIFSLLLVSSANAQEPSYTLLGKEELAGIDIYTIIQDDKYNILLGTSQGLMRYDGYEYHQYPSQNLQSLSLFGLTKDSRGDIFCFNLRGQILKVEEDSLSVHYNIPDSLLSPDFSIAFNKDDLLFVSGLHTFYIDSNKQATSMKFHFLPSPYIGQTKDGSIVFSSADFDSIYIYSSHKFKSIKYPHANVAYLFFVNQSKNLFFNEVHTNKIYKLEADTVRFIPLVNHQESKSIYHLPFIPSDQSIWITTRTGGLHVFTKDGQPLFGGHKLYSKYYISNFLEDSEGNYWFPTLGKGIIYVSNPKLKNYSNHPMLADENFSYTVYDKHGEVYLLSGSGKIFQITKEDQVNLLYINPFWKFSFLAYNKDYHSIFFNSAIHVNSLEIESQTLKKQMEPGIGSIKDIAFLNTDSFITVTSRGIDYYNYNSAKKKLFSIQTGRCYRTFFERKTQTIWVINSRGVELLKDRTLIPFLNNEEAVYATCITGDDDNIWLGTSNSGLYKIQDQKIVQRLTEKDGLISMRFTKILLKGEQLFIAHQKGIQIYNVNTGAIYSLRANDGLASNHILDFDVFENEIFVVTSENIQRIPLDKITINGTAPFLEMVKIEVNNERIQNLQNGEFTHLQNQIEFYFKAKAYQHRGELTYQYLLEGDKQGWKTVSVSENKVKYLSLSPGKYTFKVKALNEYGIKSETLSYTFTIAPPIWSTWWFWMLVSSVTIGLTILTASWQIRRIQSKNRQQQELTSSKLAAIKSQMNPHFIFNALNSIQDLILKEDIDNSYSYIVKFSNLVRKTLSYSDLDFIDLEDEINLLSIYLELEKLRIRDNFEYQIINHVEEEIKMPPMLIQPFVENALKHGLLHKEGKKKLILRFELSDMLICSIEDNGIGRVKAYEIKTRQKKQHESFSVGATKTRFDILKKHYKKPLGMEYIDLYDKHNQAIGTRVLLRIPYRQIY